MKISQKLLDKLQGWEYEEYKNLSAKDFSGKKFEVASFILLQAFLCLVVACICIYLNQEDINNWLNIFIYTFLLGFIIPYSWYPICVIVFGLGLDELYRKVYKHFSHKTKDYLRLKELETKFVDIEQQIEEDAILILCKIEIEARKRIRENRNINYDLRLKRKWQSWYEKDLETVKNNCELNSEAYKLVEENIKYLKFDREKIRRFKKLRDDLSNPYSHYSLLSSKINSLYGKPLSSNQNSTNLLISKKTSSASPPQNVNQNIKSDKKHFSIPIDKNKPSIEKVSQNVQNQKILDRNLTESHEKRTQVKKRQTEIIKLPKSSIEDDVKQLELDFEKPAVNLKNLDEIPVKKSTPKYQRIIKASSEFYLKVADKNMKTGRKGELLVIEYEKEKLISEGLDPQKYLHHTSVEDGDGYGYDIRSFDEGREIYIEVKTTTGSFWSNLFFTQNEYERMNEFNVNYYLYRIYNFNTETNFGDLFIFKGKELITSYFSFESKMYVLTDKNKTIL